MNSGPGRIALATAAVMGPLAALAAIWLPLFLHYRTPTPAIPAEVIERLRTDPGDEVFERLGRVRLGAAPAVADARALAEEILRGTYRMRSGEVLPIPPEPTRAALVTGSPMAQLQVSALGQASVLLAAFRTTREPRYLDAALRSVLAFARLERAAWLPVGFLWNDHAIAARVVVLAELWREYRRAPAFDAGMAGELLAFAARSAELLARDSHYTVRTNHGMMQNLALLHAAIAFPGLPGAAGHARHALERFTVQLPFYVSPGGVVLEHSAGYQDFALALLRDTLDELALLGLRPPPELAARFAAARCFRRHFTRPDGSVPAFGDTHSPRPDAAASSEIAMGECPPAPAAWLDQDFGYASLRGFGGTADQLLATWANFPGGAHKHADELAIWLWLDGQDWLAGSGYWPYDDARWPLAVSWRGANAPHGAGEEGGVARDSRLLGFRSSDVAPFLDLERHAADGRIYRRQVGAVGTAGVVVLDHAAGGVGGTFETVWTFAPGIAVRALDASERDFELTDTRTGRVLNATFRGGDGFTIARLRGSGRPFGGLVALEGVVQPAEAIVVTASMGAWSAVAWQPAGARATAGVRWDGPERWSWSLGGGEAGLAREANELEFTPPGGARLRLPIAAGAPARPDLDEASRRYAQAAARFPVFRDLMDYRLRATAGVALAAAGQIVALWFFARLRVPPALRLMVLAAAWLAVGWWLYDRYLI